MLKVTKPDRRQFLGAAAMPLAASQFGFASSAAASILSEGSVPPLNGATAWLNSQPLNLKDLRGKALLVNFWTYTCINWRRTLPYLRAWDAKYRQYGLTVLGVHTPEFAFEHDVENVRQAAKEMGIEYPIAIDSDYALWRAFNNRYWPAIYLAEESGNIRYHKFGEGDYEQTERAIQKLLAKAGVSGIGSQLVSVDPRDAEVAADWHDLKSQENYVGYERTENFASHAGLVYDKNHEYTSPGRLDLNQWALAGNWTAGRLATVLNTAGGRIAYQFHARDLHLVMGPVTRGAVIRFRILIDGRIPGAAHGAEVDAQGIGVATEPRMYQLVRQQTPVVDRRFEIEFLDPGIAAFSFTFG